MTTALRARGPASLRARAALARSASRSMVASHGRSALTPIAAIADRPPSRSRPRSRRAVLRPADPDPVGARLPEIAAGLAIGALRTRRWTRYDGRMAGQQAPVATSSVSVNGETRSVPSGCSVKQLLGLLDLGDRRVAVAVNRDIVSRGSYESFKLSDGDRIEVLEAVGGG